MTSTTERTICLVACTVVALLSGCEEKSSAGNANTGRGGASAGSGGASAGSGGASAGSGGASAGGGGASAGSGGASAGAGGGSAGSGGASAGAGGGSAGSGGASAGRGGASAGTGGGNAGRGGANAGASGGNAGRGGASAGNAGATAGTGGGSAGAGGGSAGTGGAGVCSACGAQESCWSDAAGSRCVARSVPLPSGFGVDATEVTRGQYAAWLTTAPAITGQPGVCTLNKSYVPDATCMAKPSVCQGGACATHPQPCIDMCDAAAYCAALGRRLCADADWTAACSANGVYTRPPGGAVGALAICNDYTAGGSTTVAVASKTGCQLPADSGFAGVFDMIGNLEEWADNCLNNSDSGFADICKPRGLPFGQGAAAPICSQSTYAERGGFRETLGFRCCTR